MYLDTYRVNYLKIQLAFYLVQNIGVEVMSRRYDFNVNKNQ